MNDRGKLSITETKDNRMYCVGIYLIIITAFHSNSHNSLFSVCFLGKYRTGITFVGLYVRVYRVFCVREGETQIFI